MNRVPYTTRRSPHAVAFGTVLTVRVLTIRALTVGAMAVSATALVGCNANKNSDQLAREAYRLRQEEVEAAKQCLALVREGQRLEKLKKLDQALNLYKQAVEVYPESPFAWNNLGRLYMQRQENMEAATAFEQAARLSPADPVPVHNLGTLYESMGWENDAQRYYTEALQRDPNYVPSLRRSVWLDVSFNKVTDLTEQRLKRALMLNKDPKWQELLLRAKVRMSDGSTDPALKSGPGPGNMSGAGERRREVPMSSASE